MIGTFTPYPGFISGDGDEPGVTLARDNPLRVDTHKQQYAATVGTLPKASARKGARWQK